MAGGELDAEEKNKAKITNSMMSAFLVMVLVTTMVVSMAPHIHHHGGGAMDVLITCFFFAFVTVQVQVIVAIALPKEAPPAPRLAPWFAWMFGITVWTFAVTYFMTYANMSIHMAPGPTCYWDLILAEVASFVNLGITAYIIMVCVFVFVLVCSGLISWIGRLAARASAGVRWSILEFGRLITC